MAAKSNQSAEASDGESDDSDSDEEASLGGYVVRPFFSGIFRRKKQCNCFQNLVHVYESEPDNVGKLMELMQEVQEYGQPPAEIIQDIAPGLELDDEGMPKVDGSTMPFPGNEDCRTM